MSEKGRGSYVVDGNCFDVSRIQTRVAAYY